MEEQKNVQPVATDTAIDNTQSPTPVEEEVPLDKNVRLMSPARMVMRRFFRSKLSIVGLVMIISLFLFCWVGPLVFTQWGETQQDESGMIEYTQENVSYVGEDGETYTLVQVVETHKRYNAKAPMSADHFLGTDQDGRDVFTRLMYGGRISLLVSFIAVFAVTVFGVVFGGIAGYFGGVVDNIIMRICDVLMCLPGFPIMLIIGTILDAYEVDAQLRIYYLINHFQTYILHNVH